MVEGQTPEDARARAIIACLLGAGFSLARGAWAVLLIGGLYLLIDGVLPFNRKVQYLGAFLAGAFVLSSVFILKYESNPLTARAGGESSVEVRAELYGDTVQSLEPRYFVTGFGMTLSRATDSTSYGEFGKYVPPAGTHSTYLNYLFRTGIPGFLGILALYGLAFFHSRTAARSFDGPRAILGTLLAAAVLIAATHALILSLYVEPVYSLVISLLIGLGMAHGKLPRSIIPWRKPKPAA